MCQKDTVLVNTILHPIAFDSKSLTSAEYRYSNIEREVLGILHGLEKFDHYYSVGDINVFTDHKPPVTMNPVNTSENSSVQGPDSIQTRAQNFYCR